MEPFPEQNPDHYKWGFIYYNPDDERVWVPKRNPALGATLNFAQPKAYLFLALLLLLPIVTSLVAILM